MQGTTEVITHRPSIIESIKSFQARTKKVWNACVEKSLPAFSVGKVGEGYSAAKARGVKISYVTEITENNLSFCREIMQFAELRHLDGVQCNFALSETEYVAGFMEEAELVSLVRTDIEAIVRQQHLVFQTLWNIAEPAADKIARLS
ncbi:MAG TPA: hypothetical protein VI338_03330 [Nitrososphaera sp.]|nr:hypothetical protein [Nitrososphaera sp.]